MTGGDRADGGLVVVEKLGAIVEDPVFGVEMDGKGGGLGLGAGKERVNSPCSIAPCHRGRC